MVRNGRFSMELKLPEMPKSLIEAFPPNAFALFMLIRPEVDDEMLKEIAAADYGNGLEENLVIMRRMLDKYELVTPLEWNPHEVLALCRWDETGPNADRRNVIQRAFCCVCLLFDSANSNSYDDFGSSDSLVRLLENILALGGEYPEAFARFIIWRLPHIDPDYARDRPFFAVALFIIAVLSRKIPEGDIPKLIDWLNEEVELERSVMETTAKKDRLLDMERCSQSDYIWRRVAERLRQESVWIESQAIRERVLDIAGRLIGNNATT
jgi:hypothetical protein